MIIRSNQLCGLLAAGLTMATVAVANAGLVTFQVDMTSQLSAASVYLRGNFNGQNFSLLPAHQLTNNGFGIYSGTINITNAPGTVIPCKFYYEPGANWEGGADRQFLLAAGPQTLPMTAWNDKYPSPTNKVTFRVDMTAQVKIGAFDPTTGYVRVSGNFNNWNNSIDFTNNPAAGGVATNIYSQTLEITGFPGSNPGEYKFRAPIGTTYESIANRPSFTLLGGNQTLPLVYWDNLAPTTPTNYITFRVDMTAQVLGGAFIPGVHPIRVAGDFPGGAFDGLDLTNNPSLSGNASNIYSTVVTIIAETNAFYKYKFRANGGYENPAPANQYPPFGDRGFTIAGGVQVLPLVNYSDASLCDLLSQITTVTFFVQITNGTVGTDGAVFNGSNLKINGGFNGWALWDALLPDMISAGSNDLYYYTTTLNPGADRAQKYKYSIGGADNEAPGGQDHIQYVRSFGNSYDLPVSKFGTNYASTRVEQAVSGLKISPAGANVGVTWDGTPCVTLQTRTTLSGSWTDLPATETLSSTNYPNTGTSRFFRLQKRSTP